MEFKTLQQKAKALGIQEIEMYDVKSKGVEMSFVDGDIEGNTTSMTDVICIRAVYNNQIATVYSEKTDDEGMDFILNSIVNNSRLISKEEPYFIYGGDKEYPTIQEKETNFEDATALEKIKICKKLDQLLKEKSPYVYKTQSGYEENDYQKTIVNSNGLDVSKKGKEAYIYCELVVKKDEDVKTAYDYLPIYKLEDIDLEAFAKKLIEEAEGQFGATSIPSGEYDIVLDKSAMRSLLQVYSSIFCADVVLKKMSFLEGKIGEKIFGDNVTIIDDPLHPKAMKQSSFDDEGVATKTKTVVENGVLKTYLHNLTTASMMGTTSTGNGSKGGVAASVGVSAQNFYLKPGTASLEDLFKHVGNGLYITDLSGLHAGVNQISGNYSLQASGYKIENGKKTAPVTLIIVSSSLQQTMNQITMIGNDFEFRGTVGASSVALSKIAISGE